MDPTVVVPGHQGAASQADVHPVEPVVVVVGQAMAQGEHHLNVQVSGLHL